MRLAARADADPNPPRPDVGTASTALLEVTKLTHEVGLANAAKKAAAAPLGAH
jgi:hypothetical protein